MHRNSRMALILPCIVLSMTAFSEHSTSAPAENEKISVNLHSGFQIHYADAFRRRADREIDQDLLGSAAFFTDLSLSGQTAKLPICSQMKKLSPGWGFSLDSSNRYVLHCLGGRCEKDPSVIYFGHDSWVRLGEAKHMEAGMFCENFDDAKLQRQNHIQIAVNNNDLDLCQKPVMQVRWPSFSSAQQKVVGHVAFSSAPRLPDGWLILELKHSSREEGPWEQLKQSTARVGDGYDPITEWYIEGMLQPHETARMTLRLSEAACRATRAGGEIGIFIYGAELGPQTN